ncbi:uncharacterized protein LY89DRAFT_716166 [Mollisia scopiformis]|uniref:Tetratricopeptide repeat protein n=1 Tax=Mollisia scopiformis TaxID=149040 RepID=A0A194XHI2_MOLSC|nr:uncharacterized protein LY89DRAFT_716166 [Mollisia scopiformis]KUJ19618.1 hypothetical protein LY89DRAFT_716166 [Mollisia scopiformis]
MKSSYEKVKKEDFSEVSKPSLVYFELATCLNRQDRLEESVDAAKSALEFYKESENMKRYQESVCDVYNLLGKLYFDLQEWNKAIFYLEKAAHGYASKLGSRDEKTVKARELLKVLEKSVRIRQGLAERLVKDREKAKPKKIY